MKSALPRLMAIVVMLVVLGTADVLKLAGFDYPELDALGAAGFAAILTAAAALLHNRN